MTVTESTETQKETDSEMWKANRRPVKTVTTKIISARCKMTINLLKFSLILIAIMTMTPLMATVRI